MNINAIQGDQQHLLTTCSFDLFMCAIDRLHRVEIKLVHICPEDNESISCLDDLCLRWGISDGLEELVHAGMQEGNRTVLTKRKLLPWPCLLRMNGIC